MGALQERLEAFRDAGATVFGVSADSPFSQGAFREAIEADDFEVDIPDLGLHGVANRAAFVLDAEGSIVYDWIADDPTNEPDYDELLEAVESD